MRREGVSVICVCYVRGVRSRDCSLLFAVMFLRVSVFVLGYGIVCGGRER